MMMMMMRILVPLNWLKIEYDVLWGMGKHILVPIIFYQNPYGFASRLKFGIFVPRTPKIDSIQQTPSRITVNNSNQLKITGRVT